MWHGNVKHPDPELVTIGKKPILFGVLAELLWASSNDKLAFDADLVVFVPKLAQQLERVRLEALRNPNPFCLIRTGH